MVGGGEVHGAAHGEAGKPIIVTLALPARLGENDDPSGGDRRYFSVLIGIHLA